jgi:hypothetical protein
MAERSEPSMEDILASIKRIIADEPAPLPQPQAPPATGYSPPGQPRGSSYPGLSAEPPPPWPQRPDPQPPESILELTQRIPDPPPPPPSFEPPVEPPLPPVQRAVERLRQAEAEAPRPTQARPVPRDLLPRTPPPRATGSDVTIEALVREMLQPMLADWIDRNLPDIVERLVQTEIRRMSERDD